METGSLILVAMIEPQAIGYHFRRKRLDWPLHITILPWFKIVEDTDVLEDITLLVSQTPRFDVIVGPDELFGETSVSLIAQPGNIETAHSALLEAIAGNIVFSKDPQWIGDNYRPHVTHHGDERLYAGDMITVDAVTIVKLIPNNMCQVIDTINLKA